ncbi:hypothetical protein GGS21DRAFT_485658 [Xylaria nigripes]|nr:hypothetical protein GGS21DRAFT_485658 [Xylaria nigripes]
MGLEHRLLRASPHAPVSRDAVLNASSIDLGRDDRATLLTGYSHPRPVSQGERVTDGPNVSDVTAILTPPSEAPQPISETCDRRSIHSSSSASRRANRLSLTLPIAPPNSLPSRPTPTASTPPTPIDPAALDSTVESDNLIIAIAAQERRVLELRDELTRAEEELKRLQRQWTISEGYKKKPPNTYADFSQLLGPAINLTNGSGDSSIATPKSELERKKAILLAQSNGAPRNPNRTVIRGGHTRTLSLLSPITSMRGLSTKDDQYIGRSSGSASQVLTKRATWAPLQTTQQTTGVQQLASDFKQGLWTFVEDLRQATIGDEAISGTTNRTAEMSLRLNKMDGDNTIRASTANRGRIPLGLTEQESLSDSPRRSFTSSHSDCTQHRRNTSRPEPRARKHFSWTPLTFDNFNEDDWSNWDSSNAKSSRWSGSTVNGDATPPIAEKADEDEAKLSRQCSIAESTAPSTNGLPHTILGHLTPSNNKTTTSNILNEWERGLAPPPQTTTFEAGLRDFTRGAH